MKLETITPFVDAAIEVSEKLTGKPAVRGDLSVMQDLVTMCPLNIVSGISGSIRGIIMFGLPRDTAMNLAEIILHKSFRVLDMTVSDALVGLGQQFLESSSSALTTSGLEVELTPAKIIRGVSVSIPTNGVPILVVPLQFEEIGTIYVKLSVKEAQAKLAA